MMLSLSAQVSYADCGERERGSLVSIRLLRSVNRRVRPLTSVLDSALGGSEVGSVTAIVSLIRISRGLANSQAKGPTCPARES